MNKTRLLKLADFLETKVKREWFDMDKFIDIGFKEKKCGTKACAAGWMPSCFPRSGLEIDGWVVNLIYTTKGKRYTNTQAVKQFFEINEDQVDDLFMHGSANYSTDNPTPKEVAKVLRRFVSYDGDTLKAFND